MEVFLHPFEKFEGQNEFGFEVLYSDINMGPKIKDCCQAMKFTWITLYINFLIIHFGMMILIKQKIHDVV
jgi:hypothetical protein